MANNVFVSVEGVPVETVIAEEAKAEYRKHHHEEISAMEVLVARSKSRIARAWRNHSGVRSGRGRVIFSAALAGGAA